MFFTVVSDKKNLNSPFILEYVDVSDTNEVYKLLEKEKSEKIILIDSFKTAVELEGDKADFFSYHIRDNIYWTDVNEFDTFLRYYFNMVRENEKNYIFNYNIIFSDGEVPANIVEYFATNDDEVFFYNESYGPTIAFHVFILSSEVDDYFKAGNKREFSKNFFEIRCNAQLRGLKLFDDHYTFKNIIQEFKRLFGDKYIEYIIETVVKAEKPIKFNDRLYSNPDTSGAWLKLFKAEDYFNNIKIYGLKRNNHVNFNFKKDNKGKEYVQYTYNASTTTGRMYATDLKNYQSIQTLQKDKRYLLEAEPGCTLIELDFKSFEYNILLSKINRIEETHFDHHINICSYMGIDEDRELGKKINYSFIYGMNLDSIASMIVEKTKKHDVEYYKNKLVNHPIFKSASDLLTKIKTIRKTFDGEETIFIYNSRRWIKIEKEHAILNNFIQSYAADILYHIIFVVRENLKKFEPKSKILFQNFDSLMFQIEDSDVTDGNFNHMIKIIDNIKLESNIDRMGGDIKVNSFPYTIKHGKNWGNMTEI